MSPIMTPYARAESAHGSAFSLHKARQLTATGLVCASVIGLTGCATCAELESLRAEIAKTNETALHAQAEASRTRSELAALKAAAKPPADFAKPRTPPTTSSTKPAGYKWGSLPRY